MRAFAGGSHSKFLLAAWAVALLAFLLLCMLPLPLVTAWLSLACCTILVGCGTALHHRRGAAARIRHGAVLGTLAQQTAHLPLDLRSDLPLVLVVGDGLDALFGDASAGCAVHRGDGALWLRVDDITLLASIAIAVREARDGRPPAGIVVTIAPARYRTEEDILQTLGRLRQAVADAARELHDRLPVFVAIYQRLCSAPAIAAPSWYGIYTGGPRLDATALTPIWHAAYGATGDRESARCAAMLDHLMHWTTATLVPALAGPRDDGGTCVVAGVAWVDAGPAQPATQTWASMANVSGSVGLPAMPASAAPWPWPAPLLQSLPRWSGPSPRQRDMAHAAGLFYLTLAIALVSAALANARLIDSTASHLRRFADTAKNGGDIHRDALAVLVDDRDRLERHQRMGVSLKLGLGMYRGHALLPRIDAAIASYQPPVVPPMVVTLDGMALFDVGKASIRSGSNHAMVSALELIRAHPDKRILVAGHTDDTGRADANLALSIARAESVRAWLMDAAHLPAPRFAIQGYGDTRPVATNADARERARNRRVEISLVTDTYPH